MTMDTLKDFMGQIMEQQRTFMQDVKERLAARSRSASPERRSVPCGQSIAAEAVGNAQRAPRPTQSDLVHDFAQFHASRSSSRPLQYDIGTPPRAPHVAPTNVTWSGLAEHTRV